MHPVKIDSARQSAGMLVVSPIEGIVHHDAFRHQSRAIPVIAP